MGGSDQWGNIVAGIDLIKRQQATLLSPGNAGGKEKKGMVIEEEKEEKEEKGEKEEKDEVFGLTTPLLTAENGEKFGKSAGNAVWLDENRTSVSDFYQVGLASYPLARV